MKNICKYISHIKSYLLVLLSLVLITALSACSQDSKDEEATTVSISIGQFSANPTSIGGDLTNITSVMITIYYDNNRETPIFSGDILASGGTLKLTVLPYNDLYITGVAFEGEVQTLSGETTVTGLQPGANVGVAFTLQAPLAVPQITVTGTISTAGSIGSVTQGATVQVLQVVNGVENVIGQGTVADANGSYSLDVAESLSLGSDIIFRVTVDQNGEPANMDARFTAFRVNIDPITHTASELIRHLVTVSATELSVISVDEILEIERTLRTIEAELGTQSELTFQDYSALLRSTLMSDLETAHVAGSTVATGQICGTVTDGTATPLEGITMVVRDFKTETLLARAHTAADGRYCVNVPLANTSDPLTQTINSGEYILGAINRTTGSYAASQWWREGGGVPLRIEAGKISLSEATAVTADFTLPPGARITGTVTAETTAERLAGVDILVRDKTTLFLSAGAATNANGAYTINVPPGEYIVEARNSTSKPFASETFTTDGLGTNNLNLGSIVVARTDPGYVADFTLRAGTLLSGTVSENDSPVTGIRIFVDNENGGVSTRLRVTKRDGSYGVWLANDSYRVYGYGQVAFPDLSQGATQDLPFNAPVAKLPVTVLHNGVPVAKAKLRLWYRGEGLEFKSMDISASDGSAMLYSTDPFSTGPYSNVLEARIEGQETYSSIIYSDKTVFSDGDDILLTNGETAGGITVTLRDAGLLTGTVQDVQPSGDILIQVSSRDASGFPQSFVETRTRGDGTFQLSLPQGIYPEVNITTPNYTTTCYDVPVTANDTTALLSYFDVEWWTCEITQSPRFITIGSVTFDSTVSADLSASAIAMPIDQTPNDPLWRLVNPIVSAVDTRTYYSYGEVVNGVPTTTYEVFDESGAFIESESLAVATNGGIYALRSYQIFELNIPFTTWAEPVLVIPADLSTGRQWNVNLGTITLTGSVVSPDTQSPAGYPNTLHIQYEHINLEIQWNMYFGLNGEGLLEESSWDFPSYFRQDLPPPQVVGVAVN